jgi:hypothetical protein
MLSIMMLAICITLKKIMVDKKAWDVLFWVLMLVFLSCFGFYGYVSHSIYVANTFSYDGFLACAAFLSITGILFSSQRYVGFSDKFFGSRYAHLFSATFIVFSIIYIATIDYDIAEPSYIAHVYVDIIKIVLYPLVMIFTLSAFLFRYSVCLPALAFFVIIFTIKSVAAIIYAEVYLPEGINITHQIVVILITIFICALSVIILAYIMRKRAMLRRKIM